MTAQDWDHTPCETSGVDLAEALVAAPGSVLEISILEAPTSSRSREQGGLRRASPPSVPRQGREWARQGQGSGEPLRPSLVFHFKRPLSVPWRLQRLR